MHKHGDWSPETGKERKKRKVKCSVMEYVHAFAGERKTEHGARDGRGWAWDGRERFHTFPHPRIDEEIRKPEPGDVRMGLIDAHK